MEKREKAPSTADIPRVTLDELATLTSRTLWSKGDIV